MFKGLRKAGVAATLLHVCCGKTTVTHTVPSLEKLKYCGILSANHLHSNLVGWEKSKS